MIKSTFFQRTCASLRHFLYFKTDRLIIFLPERVFSIAAHVPCEKINIIPLPNGTTGINPTIQFFSSTNVSTNRFICASFYFECLDLDLSFFQRQKTVASAVVFFYSLQFFLLISSKYILRGG